MVQGAVGLSIASEIRPSSECGTVRCALASPTVMLLVLAQQLPDTSTPCGLHEKRA